jgi:hypothetical protein
VPVVLGGVAAALVVAATRDGLGTSPDGVSYLGAASNLAGGRGLTGPFVTMVDPFHPAEALAFDGAVPFIQWPPLYPLLLGSAATAGVAPTEGARALAVVSLAVTVALVARITWRLAPGAWPAAAVAGLVVLLSPLVALLHVLVASEHLFLALSLGSLWCAATHFGATGVAGRGSCPAPWAERGGVAAVLLAGAATSTRFAGVAVVAALVVGELTFGAGGWRRRVAGSALVAAVGVGPAWAWSMATSRAAGVPPRDVGWHPPDREQWESVADTVLGWLAPATASTPWRVATVALALLALGAAVLGWWRAMGARRASAAAADRSAGSGQPAPAEAAPWLVLATTFVVVEFGVVLATHTLADRAVPIGQRMVVPLLPPVAVTVAAGAAWWWRSVAPAEFRRRAVMVAMAAVAVVGLAPLRSTWWSLAAPGRPWPDPVEETPTARWLAGLPPEAVVASNDPSLAWQSSGNFTIAVPVRRSAPTGEVNPRVAVDLVELREGLVQRHGVAVIYRSAAFFHPDAAGVGDLEAAGFDVVATFDDATVLSPTPDR